jgi:hypothetical protein
MQNKAVTKYLADLGARGGKAAAANMTPQQRTERARKAARARYYNRRQDTTQ